MQDVVNWANVYQRSFSVVTSANEEDARDRFAKTFLVALLIGFYGKVPECTGRSDQ